MTIRQINFEEVELLYNPKTAPCSERELIFRIKMYCSDIPLDYCHAGDNYGYPHQTGWTSCGDRIATNCFFCGIEISQQR